MKLFNYLWVACLLALLAANSSAAIGEQHPKLTISQTDVQGIISRLDEVPRAQQAYKNLKQKLSSVLANPIEVPLPADAGGGYTHEQHKRNYQTLYDLGLAYQLSRESKYLEHAKRMFLVYADLYPTLGVHPKRKEQSPGRLFWQSLNEAVFLVHTIQAYDMLYTALNEAERRHIETGLFRPLAAFLSEGQPDTFNKIHNHGTWAVAAVGMTGYVLGDEVLVKQALLGLDMQGNAGFLKQIEQLFSPDGYYAEGPYYQRYALMPFVLFAKAINLNEPEREIFLYKDQALLKAIKTTVQLSYNGLLFGINDAIKDKGIDTIELVHGVAIAYEVTQDRSLLSIAERQNQVLLTGYGFAVAAAIEKGLAEPFGFTSLQLRDGQKGDQGALSIFRSDNKWGHQALVMKNTSQGLGHGHFDKLHWMYFDNGNEIISDYGAARFLNIEAKYGGHYLPENNAWAKQTVAHNTVVVDGKSQFGGDWRVSQQYAPRIHFFAANPEVKISSASIYDAYPGTSLTRTMAMIEHPDLEHAIVVDLFQITSETEHQYDLPLHYQGQIISHNLALESHDQQLKPLGAENGYQYLWNRARGKVVEELAQLTWLKDNRFYTYSTIATADQEFVFAQLGANDPNFNLRTESSLIHRVPKAKNHIFVSVLETHGEYNGRAEYTVAAKSQVSRLQVHSKDDVNIIELSLINGRTLTFFTTNAGGASTEHRVEYSGGEHDWRGHYSLTSD